MGKKILGFVLFLSVAGFIMLFATKIEHEEIRELPKELRRKEYFKLYFFNSVTLLVNVFFWLILIALCR